MGESNLFSNLIVRILMTLKFKICVIGVVPKDHKGFVRIRITHDKQREIREI